MQDQMTNITNQLQLDLVPSEQVSSAEGTLLAPLEPLRETIPVVCMLTMKTMNNIVYNKSIADFPSPITDK